jgi:hypothetical protein
MTDLVTLRTLCLRLCALCAFSCALLVGRGAQAAAPMCGEHGQSIAAPPIGLPTSTAALHGERPCDALTLILDQSTPSRQAPQKLSFEPAPDRALPVVLVLGDSPRLMRLAAPAANAFAPSDPLSRSVYRPPRA